MVASFSGLPPCLFLFRDPHFLDNAGGIRLAYKEAEQTSFLGFVFMFYDEFIAVTNFWMDKLQILNRVVPDIDVRS